MATPQRNAKLMEHIDFVKSIDDRESRPLIMPFEGTTTAAPAAPGAMLYTVPEKRHLLIYEVSGFVQPAAANPVTTEADLMTQWECQVTIDHELNLFSFGTSTGRINMSQIMGTPLHPRSGFELKFPFHVRPNCDINVQFFLLAGFVAAARILGIALNCEWLMQPGAGQ